MKIPARLFASMLTLGLVIGCQSSPINNQNEVKSHADTKEVTITWLHHFDEEGARRWLEQGTAMYTKLHPEVNFHLVGVDGGNYMNLLRTRVVADNMPDLYMIDTISSSLDIIDKGYAADVSDQPFIHKIQEKYLNGVKTSDGKIWAMPIDVNGVGVIYNKDVFAKAGITKVPATWAEFIQVCQQLRKVGVTPIAAGFKDQWTLFTDIAPDLLANETL
ncbi:ABC transporter substrate-binding protein [Paenibacillus hexagrammi]|uniref:ABC transporter substrate-binding protein n=1 Tax=Paenibacillus hexagrammi TaxID=2908839 RepID=A0ABY3SEA7_9BACL|nr:ABC transporter substrate-binding protein [Paenibacillus sp. YPD9-1]UJF31476.1 ABC transporter substrate-binding protein [Paenibacillus sp. YPD9-1]